MAIWNFPTFSISIKRRKIRFKLICIHFNHIQQQHDSYHQFNTHKNSLCDHACSSTSQQAFTRKLSIVLYHTQRWTRNINLYAQKKRKKNQHHHRHHPVNRKIYHPYSATSLFTTTHPPIFSFILKFFDHITYTHILKFTYLLMHICAVSVGHQEHPPPRANSCLLPPTKNFILL